MSDTIRSNEWTSGLESIRMQAVRELTDSGAPAFTGSDITLGIIDLATSIWGKHDFHPNMIFKAHKGNEFMRMPFVYLSDNLILNRERSGELQGGRITPASGLITVDNEILMWDWLSGRDFPEGSPFLIARILIEQTTANKDIQDELESFRASRGWSNMLFFNREKERKQEEEATKALVELTRSHPLLSKLLDGISDENRYVFAQTLQRSRSRNRLVIVDSSWGIDTANLLGPDQARSLLPDIDENGIIEYQEPTVLCELVDNIETRGREGICVGRKGYADRQIVKWMQSQAGNHGDRSITPIGFELSENEKDTSETMFPAVSMYFGQSVTGRMIWKQSLPYGYTVAIDQETADSKGVMKSTNIATLYIPCSKK